MKPSTSYAITVYNEHKELQTLLEHLSKYLRDEDEIIVVRDIHSGENTEVLEVLKNFPRVKSYTYNFNNNFSNLKNYLNSNCTKNYIFNIDTDEIPSKDLIELAQGLIDEGPDLIWVPRINHVEGITQEYIKKWHWKIDKDNRINYPDRQGRIYKNSENIYWINPVHEKITGKIKNEIFIENEKYALLHDKTIEKQIQQNTLYNAI